MSRTPLFRMLRRSLRLAQASLRTGESAATTLERWRAAENAARVSRRQFLGTSALAAAGAALASCAPRRAPRTTGAGAARPVVVVGGGIAGLTAAYRLHQQRVPVRVYEAQSRVGGRMFSLRGHFADSQVVELGGELIDTGHTRIRRLAAELGVALDDLSQEDPALATELFWFGGARRSEAEVVDAFRPVAARIEADVATIGGDGSVTYAEPNGAEPLDRMSIAQWLDGEGVSGWFRELLDVGYTTEYGLEIDRQSALNFLLMIDPNPDPFKIFGESDERFHAHAGNDAIPAELARRLEGAIETGMVLEAVSQRLDGSWRCAFRRGSASVDVDADHLLLAIPFTLLRDVRLDVELPAVKRRAIAELGYGTNAKLMVGFAERVWRRAHRSNGSVMAELPFQTTWETSRHQAGAAGVLTNFTGGDHGVELGKGSAAEQAAALVRDLERVFPGVAAARSGMAEARFHWPSHPWTRGSYASYLVGQWTAICGAEGERVGRLHFAGEHCSLEAQGFMEGGCETGEAAAREILDDLGIEVPEEPREASEEGSAAA
jgi:monoamine oxidase